MRAIGLIGYHNSGKTFIGTRIAGELKKRGYTVSAIKHIHGTFLHADKDTTHFAQQCQKVIGLSGDEVITIEKGSKGLQTVLLSLQTDFVIIEGFKKASTFPKIICDKPEGEILHHNLEIAHIQREDVDNKKITWLCDLIEEKAFFLSGVDCKKCGFSSCSEYAEAIIKGEIAQVDCLSLPKDIHLSIDGEEFPLHPFVSNTFKGTILGFIRNLKGYKEGKITIEIL